MSNLHNWSLSHGTEYEGSEEHIGANISEMSLKVNVWSEGPGLTVKLKGKPTNADTFKKSSY